MRFLFLFTLTLFTTMAANEHPAAMVGIYEGRFPAADVSERRIRLDIHPDGTAALTTEITGKSKTTDPGTWTSDGKLLRVGLAGKSALVWSVSGWHLKPKEWDRALYGKKGLPLQRPH